MRTSNIARIVLCISGLIGIGIGGIILISPVDFYASNHIDIGENASLLSEIRAPAGALLACGILIMSGAFFSQLTFTSFVVSTLLFLSYGFSRIISMAVDGMPTDSLVFAAVLEIVFGFLCMFFLMKDRLVE